MTNRRLVLWQRAGLENQGRNGGGTAAREMHVVRVTVGTLVDSGYSCNDTRCISFFECGNIGSRRLLRRVPKTSTTVWNAAYDW